MKEKAMLAPGCTAIQEAAAVQTLMAYINRRHGLPTPESDEDLLEFRRLDPGFCLMLDGDERSMYHVAAPAGCFCPAGQEPTVPCGHSKRFFPAKEIKAFEKVVAQNVLQG
jgi:hypothetical protein